VAYTMQRLDIPAQMELRDFLSDPAATAEDRLAAVQAMLVGPGPLAAEQVRMLEAALRGISADHVGGALLARVQLCLAAVYYKGGDTQRALAALPSPEHCCKTDAEAVGSL